MGCGAPTAPPPPSATGSGGWDCQRRTGEALTCRRRGVKGSTEGTSILEMSVGTGQSGESPGWVLSLAEASSQARRIAVNRSSSVGAGKSDGLFGLLGSLLPPPDKMMGIGMSELPAKARDVMCHICVVPGGIALCVVPTHVVAGCPAHVSP